MKKIINTTVAEEQDRMRPRPEDVKPMAGLADQVMFSPQNKHRMLKAKFWSKFQPGPFHSPETVSAALVQEITKSSIVKECWSLPGFKEWFLNQDEAREKLEYLFLKSLDIAEQLLDDPDTQGNAKVQMIKVLAELANKFPTKTVEKYADESISKMNDTQLRLFLEKKGITVNELKMIDIDKKEE